MSSQTESTEAPSTPDIVGFPKRRRMAAITMAVIVAVAASGWYIGRFIQSPAEIAAATGPPEPSSILASAEMRLMTTDVVSRGTASFGSPQKLALATTKLKTAPAVVTDLPPADSTLAEGDVALTVSERPVFLLQGRQPSYRDLGPGMSGEDVRQLEAALARIGFSPGPADGTFDASTAAAVTRMYSRAGYEPLVATDTQLAAVRSREADLIQGARAYSGVQVPADEVIFAGHAPLRVSGCGWDLVTRRRGT
ncbi:MAG: peptidoglycan-binding domain-containing protein [Solirubrobacterales bacterium]